MTEFLDTNDTQRLLQKLKTYIAGTGGTVDQTFDETSANAQSGKAIAKHVNSHKATASESEHGSRYFSLEVDDITNSDKRRRMVITTTNSGLNIYTNWTQGSSTYAPIIKVDLTDQNYVDAADAVLQSQIGNLQSQINELGEPFRVKNWASNTLNVTIVPCTSDAGNTSLDKMVFTIDNVEGADYQIVGMIAYELFDAASGGNRINAWPVCQFTGNGQKELSVRWVCAGTTNKVAKRINAWVLLKHR